MGAVQNFGLWTNYDLIDKENVERPGCKLFCWHYGFAHENTVLIDWGLGLRADPSDTDKVNQWGQMGAYSRWIATPLSDGYVKFKNVKTGKYLRLSSSKTSVNVRGAGTHDWCKFKYKKDGDFVKLEFKKASGKYLEANKDGVRVGNGGTRFKIWRRTK
eukprot:269856_1